LLFLLFFSVNFQRAIFGFPQKSSSSGARSAGENSDAVAVFPLLFAVLVA